MLLLYTDRLIINIFIFPSLKFLYAKINFAELEGEREREREKEREKKKYIQFEVFTAKTRCTKTNTYPHAGHDGLLELWETICQAQYRPSSSLSNPCELGVHSRCCCPSWGCVLQCGFTYTLPYELFSASRLHPFLPLLRFRPKSLVFFANNLFFFFTFPFFYNIFSFI